ncbi:MAG: multicopper oxidase domain-containing protein [Anaerolineae bacterium]|nr:multicopper oxidase domain-containing protein [Anaerolineae bacterium]MCB9101110.1 multicopper oxidase domain-containing protein [Anaerolineales bacterium]
MTEKRTPRRVSRRDILKLGGSGALLALMGGSGLNRLLHNDLRVAAAAPVPRPALQPGSSMDIRLLATDGWMGFPGRRRAAGEGIYSFGFRPVAANETYAKIDKLIQKYKGKVTWPAPILAIPKDIDLYIAMTNLGFVQRPDLDDSHTIHWHGFRNPNSVFDGVPEVSIAVPLGRNFPYYFKPRDEGTYMYHCHFEDVEHVQMGMDGVVYIEANTPGHAYDNDSAISTAFDRQFTFMLNEIYSHAHDNLENVQENLWSDYKADYWVMNGRSYPDTVLRDQELPGSDFDLGGDLYSQPISSLIQTNPGDRVLLRIANLGYEQHAMQIPGIPMTVVGQDASYLGSNYYEATTIYLGPGEARDVLFTAPNYSGPPDGTDGAGPYNRYWFRNRNAQRLINGTESGLGGMLTEVRVYPVGTLGAQTGPNKTF